MTNMDTNLRMLMGIADDVSGSTINPADLDEFGEYKDQPKPEVKFELEMKETSVPDLVQSDAKVDYAYARSMNYQLLAMTTSALAKALAVANETEHPRAFESFNSLATTARGLTQDLLALQKVFKEVTKGRTEMEPPPPTTVMNVNVGSNGSTTDLMKLLQESIDRGEIKPMGLSDEDEDDKKDGGE